MDELILSIDTATPAGSVALTRGDQLIGETTLNLKSTHSERLLAVTNALLTAAEVSLHDLTALAVVRGPGSFTGLRVGMGTVQGLALAASCPVVPVSSLPVLAMNGAASSLPVWALIDARKNEVYAGRYVFEQGVAVAQCEERVAPIGSLLKQWHEPALFLGLGARVYRSEIEQSFGDRAHFLPPSFDLPRAAFCAQLALDAYRSHGGIPVHQLAPVYLRKSEAEMAKEKQG